VSRSGKKFGNKVLGDLSGKGYEILPIHPEASEIGGVRCYPSLSDLPTQTGGLVLVVPPSQTEHLVEEAREVGIARVWMQPGAESDAAIEFCLKSGLEVIYGECIMMHAQPGGIHKAHRWLRGVFGQLPTDDAKSEAD
jgi:predicted CoA-binding protein